MLLIKTSSTIKRLLQNIRRFHASKIFREYDGPGKTTVDIININKTPELSDTKQRNSIKSCLPIGFTLSDASLLLGPIAVLNGTFFSWNVGSTNDINEETLSLFTVLYPVLDVLVLGLETKCEYSRIREIREILRKYNIKSEISEVQQACGIYNFLANDGRYVAAGLIPPISERFNTHRRLSIENAEAKKLTDQ
ncbi:hypothetical protein E2986_04124 [Frieseomelitta varia]|uniref:NADH dehydrogenase [ubiquinone] 1 alpha subcomplex assembly factor 3 n=1 Tax=Frieseomelitta varia TaxID=561572 RepID=A0A833SCU1_9HYME|nr:NADH dehydrogenase [ubiquinone] 1 alpha subcomplex assembly factor 3 [Frieseomelitta varia]XP_043517063.1 NADH dehydrogenase [ubiquinone] 1 alpha subcomplex assembly factor 3 [Frieseomelitta varia]KAF3424668.1 hypothetical protein E2986_04124 [Frieseomelitta varia]